MKITIAIVFTLICIVVQCRAQSQQNYDSLTQRILRMDAAINTIHFNMVKSQSEFRTGTFLLVAGTALSIAGALIKTDKDSYGVTKNNGAFFFIGTGIATIGMIVQIDSHKWIGRGQKRFESNSQRNPSATGYVLYRPIMPHGWRGRIFMRRLK